MTKKSTSKKQTGDTPKIKAKKTKEKEKKKEKESEKVPKEKKVMATPTKQPGQEVRIVFVA